MGHRCYKVKPCTQCGKEFKPNSSTAKYCSQCHLKMAKSWAERSANNAKWKYRLEHETFIDPYDFLKSRIEGTENFDLEDAR